MPVLPLCFNLRRTHVQRRRCSLLPLLFACPLVLMSRPAEAQTITITGIQDASLFRLIVAVGPRRGTSVLAHKGTGVVAPKKAYLLSSRGMAPNKTTTPNPHTVPGKIAARIPGATFASHPEVMSAAWQAAAVEIVAAGRGRINYEAGIVKAIGLGAIAPPTMKKSRSQDILDARDAAFNDALRSLSIAVSQVRVTADTRVSNYVVKNDEVRTRVESMLKNAELVEEKILPKSGVYRVVVQAKMSGPNSLMEAIEPVTARPTPVVTAKPMATPAPERPNPFAPGAPAPADAEYTSLVIDCRGLKVAACMSPRVYDTSGQEVYGTMKISPDYVIETGIASFPRSVSEARECRRAGNNPLFIRAIGVSDQNRFYPVIRNRDAERARSANESSHFFERTAVILLLDPE